MTERTYGGQKLETIEDFALDQMKIDMAAHIRELQAEVNIYKSCTTPTEINLAARILELESEVEKLKAERREFGVRVGEAIIKAYFSGKHNNVPIETIVEQELNK